MSVLSPTEQSKRGDSMQEDNEKNIEELKRIRKKFKASRDQFGSVFLGRTKEVIANYERGKTIIPLTAIMLARSWEQFLDALRGDHE